MMLFFFVFFTLYAGMHLYALLKIRAAFAPAVMPSILLSIIMVILVFSPVIVRQSERHGLELFARLFSYIGYTWMGVLFLFFAASIVIDAYNVLTHLAGLIAKSDLSHLRPSSKYSFMVPFLVSLTISVYGYFEAKDIRTERLVIRTSKIPSEIGSLKIVQISDVHIGLIVRGERLKKIIDRVNDEKPDILVSTGDLVDGQINSIQGISEMFMEIKPKYGKFAITGNHEFYAGLSHALEFTRESGFTILRGEGIEVGGFLNIVGVDDPAGRPFRLYKEVSERELLLDFRNNKFTLFLKHRPLINKESIGLFDLQLSGHAHKGQIFPFSILTRLYYPLHAGSHVLPDNSYIYVSRGSGTWGPPIRFLSRPEVTIIELIHIDK
jgi:predicted MPP superfamily phosphohydrolase